LELVEAALGGTNIAQSIRPDDGPLIHMWSLAEEWQFYLLFPPTLAYALVFLEQRRIAFVLAGLWLLLTFARAPLLVFGAPAGAIYYSPIFHATGLILGAAIALARPPIRLGLAALMLVISVLLLGSTRTPWMFGVDIPVAEIATAGIILAPPPALAFRPLVAIGRLSYGAYLWHLPIFFALLAAHVRGWPSLLPATLGITLVFASFSYLLVERPGRESHSRLRVTNQIPIQ
jgi:peptidoglycan/LPS O-acetylase OafA/YrhL